MFSRKIGLRFSWLRLLLGFAQMSLVGMSVGSLIAVGLRPITWILVSAATGLTIFSMLIFGRPAKRK